MYNVYITRIKNLRPHSNADRLLIGDCFGNPVIVSLDCQPDQLGVYLPTDGQVSVEFAEANNLLRRKDDAGNNVGGYLDAEKRNIKALRLRGEKSDGLFLDLDSLSSFGDISSLKEGDIVTVFNGHEIACKYIPRRNSSSHSSTGGNRTRKKKVPVSPLFAEHADTEQLAYNLGAFKAGDYIEVSLKMHGTSQRTGYLPVLSGYKRTLWDRLTRKEGTPIYDWGYVSGTRRVVLDNYDGGFYGSNEFREQHSKVFEGKLMKGETCYYEVVGFTTSGQPIMGDGNNEKVGKEFVKQYGKTTTFSYGCVPTPETHYTDLNDLDSAYIVSQSDIYVYRMTFTNEDGFTIDYTPDFVRYRCEQMGVKTVPLLWSGIIPEHTGSHDDYTIEPGEWIKKIAEQYYDGPDPIGKTHVREGVVVRIVNRPKFCAFKHKNHNFKMLEGIIKESAEAPDVEEAQDIVE